MAKFMDFWPKIKEYTESRNPFFFEFSLGRELPTDPGLIIGGRKSRGMLELYHAIQQVPILTVSQASEILKSSISKPTLYAAANELENILIF